MSFYPPKINLRFQNPKYAGKIENANASAVGATFVCGAAMHIDLLIDRETKKILDARFRTNACGYAIAAADILAEKTVGKFLSELQGADRKFLTSEIMSETREIEAGRTHCIELVSDALQSAFANFRALQIDEFAGEKALVCTCFGVTEERIEKLAAENNLTTIEEVSDLCGAGDGCGSCRFLIRDIIDSVAREKVARKKV